MSGSARLRAARVRRLAALRVALRALAGMTLEEREAVRTSRVARESLAALSCQRVGGSVPFGDYVAGRTRALDLRAVQAALYYHLHPRAAGRRRDADSLLSAAHGERSPA